MIQTENHIIAQTILNQLQSSIRSDGLGQLVLISSAHSGDGVSYIARSIALAAAAHYAPMGQRALLLDYDIYKQCQLQALMDTGSVQGPYDASFGVVPFWQVQTEAVTGSTDCLTANYNSLYLQDQSGLATTVFRWDKIEANQTVNIIDAPHYWTALRQNFAMVIVDGPAIDRTNMSASLYPHMDSVAIVAKPQNAQSAQTLQMAKDVQRFGGQFSGLILSDIIGRP